MPAQSREYWKSVVGYAGLYRVSSWGRVMSLPRQTRNGMGTWVTKRKIIQGSGGPDRYKIVGLRSPDNPGTKKQVYVHQLVLGAFVGPCPIGMECRHLDGNPSNNFLSNLRWGTHLENMEDMRRHGSLDGKMARVFSPEAKDKLARAGRLRYRTPEGRKIMSEKAYKRWRMV